MSERGLDRTGAGVLAPGSRVGRYELLVPVAAGGMARVWAARDTQGQQGVVAVKTILPELAQLPEFQKMFIDEASVASRVVHPNVAQIYELGSEAGNLFIAMEWVDGDSFGALLRVTHTIDPRLASRAVADACAGLHVAHELTDEHGRPLQVVHRDLSPHNLLLTKAGQTKLVDFGVVKALDQIHEPTTTGELKGKTAYMAPEQVSGGAAIDRRTDIFGLGCLLYEATLGHAPYAQKKGDHDVQVLTRLLRGVFPRPTDLNPSFPQELEQILLCMLSHDPNGRFATAEDLRQALEGYLARSGPPVPPSAMSHVLMTALGGAIGQRDERIMRALRSANQNPSSPSVSHSHARPRPANIISTGSVRARLSSLPPDASVSQGPFAGMSETKYYLFSAGLGLAAAVFVSGLVWAVWFLLKPSE